MSKPTANRAAIHVHVMPESRAEQLYLVTRGEAVAPRVIAAGIPAHPDYDLVYQGGKTIPNLTFTFF